MKAEEVIADLYSKTGESNVYGIDVADGKVKDVNETVKDTATRNEATSEENAKKKLEFGGGTL